MTNYKKRTDANQKKIIDALRGAGASVTDISRFGEGVPDLLVGWRGATYLLEVKTAKGKLTTSEERWFDEWRGQAAVVRTAQEAFDAVGLAAEWVEDEFQRFMLDCDPQEAEFPCQDYLGD